MPTATRRVATLARPALEVAWSRLSQRERTQLVWASVLGLSGLVLDMAAQRVVAAALGRSLLSPERVGVILAVWIFVVFPVAAVVIRHIERPSAPDELALRRQRDDPPPDDAA